MLELSYAMGVITAITQETTLLLGDLVKIGQYAIPVKDNGASDVDSLISNLLKKSKSVVNN